MAKSSRHSKSSDTDSRRADRALVLIAILASLVIGFFIGRIDFGGGEESGGGEEPTEQGNAEVEVSGTADGTEETAKGMTSGQLAEKKNVPEKIETEQGDYTLVTVVEGEEANRALHRSLQVVNVQRQRLTQLSRKYDQTDPKLAQQRELIAGQINETRRSLEQNLMFMAKNFGYLLSNNYIQVPHRATLNSTVGKGEDQLKTVVYTFEDSEGYKAFQKQNEAYTRLKREQLKAYRATQSEAEKKEPVPRLPLTPEMEKVRGEMVSDYQCDPEKTYVMEFQKTALYARKAQ